MGDRKAAVRSYDGPRNNLAVAYAPGQRVPKDVVEAKQWFALGETHGENQRSDLGDMIVKQLMPALLAEAEKRAEEFMPAK